MIVDQIFSFCCCCYSCCESCETLVGEVSLTWRWIWWRSGMLFDFGKYFYPLGILCGVLDFMPVPMFSLLLVKDDQQNWCRLVDLENFGELLDVAQSLFQIFRVFVASILLTGWAACMLRFCNGPYESAERFSGSRSWMFSRFTCSCKFSSTCLILISLNTRIRCWSPELLNAACSVHWYYVVRPLRTGVGF